MSISSFIATASFSVEFPRLMNLIERPGLVLLFSAPGVATVVAVPHAEPTYTVGHHDTRWHDASFELFNGELNLCNEADVFIDDGEDDGEGHVLGGLAQHVPSTDSIPPTGSSCPDCRLQDKPQAPAGAFVRAVSLEQLLAILQQGGEVTRG